MDEEELTWAINDVESERKIAIAKVAELTAILDELMKKEL